MDLFDFMSGGTRGKTTKPSTAVDDQTPVKPSKNKKRPVAEKPACESQTQPSKKPAVKKQAVKKQAGEPQTKSSEKPAVETEPAKTEPEPKKRHASKPAIKDDAKQLKKHLEEPRAMITAI